MNGCDFCEWNEAETKALMEREQGLIDRIEALEVEVASLIVEASYSPAPVVLNESWV